MIIMRTELSILYLVDIATAMMMLAPIQGQSFLFQYFELFLDLHQLGCEIFDLFHFWKKWSKMYSKLYPDSLLLWSPLSEIPSLPKVVISGRVPFILTIN